MSKGGDSRYLPPMIDSVAKISRKTLINKKRVRIYLLDAAKKSRYHSFTAVKSSTLDLIEGEIRSLCEAYVRRIPSKGKRL